MATKDLPVTVTKMTQRVRIEIDRDKLESFMNVFGLFRRDFLQTIKKSELDHSAGRTKRRQSLSEI